MQIILYISHSLLTGEKCAQKLIMYLCLDLLGQVLKELIFNTNLFWINLLLGKIYPWRVKLYMQSGYITQ